MTSVFTIIGILSDAKTSVQISFKIMFEFGEGEFSNYSFIYLLYNCYLAAQITLVEFFL